MLELWGSGLRVHAILNSMGPGVGTGIGMAFAWAFHLALALALDVNKQKLVVDFGLRWSRQRMLVSVFVFFCWGTACCRNLFAGVVWCGVVWDEAFCHFFRH